MEQEQFCGNCLYWRLSPRQARATSARIDVPACHRLPPSPQIGADAGFKWPCTDKRDWCGEWQPCWEDVAATRGITADE